MVSIGGDSMRVEPFSHAKLSVSDQDHYAIKTTTDSGELIEQFDVDIPSGSSQSIYNVGGASALVEWTATYGTASASKDRVVGPVRWMTSNADFIFEEPPSELKGSSNTRKVMSAYGHESPSVLVQVITDKKQIESVAAGERIVEDAARARGAQGLQYVRAWNVSTEPRRGWCGAD
jgi:hypothetical protein